MESEKASEYLKEFFVAIPIKEDGGFFDFDSNYNEYLTKRKELEENWRNSDEIRQGYKKNFKKYLHENIDESSITDAAKNYLLLKQELDKRHDKYIPSKYTKIGTFESKKTLLEILESYENIEHIQDMYRMRKINTISEKNSGITPEQAKKVRYCLRQGRELYLAGQNGDHVVKPLNYFYSITSFAYAIVLLNNPCRYKLESLSNSHGIEHRLQSGNIAFGGDIQQGTFSELFYAFCSEYITGVLDSGDNYYINFNRISSLKSFQKNRFIASLNSLFSMVPEMHSLFSFSNNTKIHKICISNIAHTTSTSYTIKVGNGQEFINEDFLNCFPYETKKQQDGKLIINVPIVDIKNSTLPIYCDIYGNLTSIMPTIKYANYQNTADASANTKILVSDNLCKDLQLPEFCLHFLIIFALSNIMRYQPEVWGAILANEHETKFATMIRYYLTIFEQKLPFLALKHTSDYYPVIC